MRGGELSGARAEHLEGLRPYARGGLADGSAFFDEHVLEQQSNEVVRDPVVRQRRALQQGMHGIEHRQTHVGDGVPEKAEEHRNALRKRCHVDDAQHLGVRHERREQVHDAGGAARQVIALIADADKQLIQQVRYARELVRHDVRGDGQEHRRCYGAHVVVIVAES